MERQEQDYIYGAIESLLFINEKPVTLELIKDAIKTLTPQEIKKIIHDLKDDYDKNRRGMVIVEIAGGYQMLSNPFYVDYVRSFYKTRVKEKLSRPALETLAIVAYKQPVSRADIELIRGVNSDGVVTHLLEKNLIKIVGRKDVPGRPYLHGTTKLFLEYFGLRSLTDMPKLEDFPGLVEQQGEQQSSEGGEDGSRPENAEGAAGEAASGGEPQAGEDARELKHAMEEINVASASHFPEAADQPGSDVSSGQGNSGTVEVESDKAS